MTRAVLLAFLTLCFSRVPLVPAANGADPSGTATCEEGKNTIIRVDKLGTFPFQCPNNYNLEGKPAKDKPGQAGIFMTSDSNDKTTKRLCETVPGATCVPPEQNQNVYTVHINQLPPRQLTVHFQCKNQDKHCFVGLEIHPSSRLGPNNCVAQRGEIALAIEQPNEYAVFGCGAGRHLLPSDKKNSFDGVCSKEVPLFEDAALTEDGSNYRLTVPSLPSQETKLCYVCVGSDNNKEEGCKVLITVAASKKGGAASVGVPARTAAALGLTLVAFSLLRGC